MPETLLMMGHTADWIAVSEILCNLAIVGAATIGLGLAWWRTAALNRQAASGAAQAAVSRREHAADVFSRAVGQIGNDRLEVRMGAIVSLAALSRDFPELSQPVFDVLAAYSRTRSEDFEAERPDIDVAAIINILQTSIERE